MEHCVNTQLATSSDVCNKDLKILGNDLNICQDNQWDMNPGNDMTMADITRAVSSFITGPMTSMGGHTSPKKEPEDLGGAFICQTDASNETVDNNTWGSRSAQTTSCTNDLITEGLFSKQFELTNKISSTNVLQCKGLQPTTYMDDKMIAYKNTTLATTANASNLVMNRILQMSTRSREDDNIEFIGNRTLPTSAVDVSRSCPRRNFRSNTINTRECGAGINTQNTVIHINKSSTNSSETDADHSISDCTVVVNNTNSDDHSADADWFVEQLQMPNDPQHYCNVCYNTYTSLDSLKSHMRTHPGEVCFFCKIGNCRSCVRTKRGLDTHTRKFHPGQPVIYSIKVIKRKSTSTCKAVRRQFVCRQYSLQGCDLTFPSERQLNTHFRKDHKSGGYICKKCGKRFLRKSLFEQHDNVHKRIKPYKCKVCGKRFHTNTEQLGHFRIHHVDPEIILQCEVCGKVGNRTYMSHHKEAHLKKRYPCQECSDDFLHPNLLKDHMRMHRGEEKYKCDLCSQTFVQRKYLAGHLRRHSKRYPCPKCSKEFTCNRFLQGHLLQHVGIKKHCCNVCGKTFAHIHYLFTHMKCHGGKLFECAICGGKFNRKDNLKSHIIRHQTTGRKDLKKR